MAFLITPLSKKLTTLAFSISEEISKFRAFRVFLINATYEEPSKHKLLSVQQYFYIYILWLIQHGPRWTPDVGQWSDHLDYHLVQYAYDVTVLLVMCACHHHALLMELTAPPGCLGLDPRGILMGEEPGPSLPLQVLAMPCFFSPLSTTNHYRADGVVPAGAALPVKLIAKRV